MPSLALLRARLDRLPLDRGPLRRAGVLTVLLVVLLAATQAMAPARPRAAARQSVQGSAESVSAPARPSGWSAGRVGAVLLLAGGGAFALFLRRKAGAAPAGRGGALDVLDTHSLGPGHSLRLVACGDEVLLLSVGSDGARLLRNWPRAEFDGGDGALAELAPSTPPTSTGRTVDPAPSPVPVDEPVWTEGEPASAEPLAEAVRAPRGVLFPAADARPPHPIADAGPTLPAQFASAVPSPAGALPTAPSFADLLRQFEVGDDA